MDAEHKASKIAFVSGHTGCPLWQSLAITALIPCTHLAWCCVDGVRQPSLGAHATGPKALYRHYVWEFTLIIAPATLLHLTDGWTPAFAAAAECLLVTVLITLAVFNTKRKSCSASTERGARELPPWLTHYRGCVMALTCTSILAVDFPAYPRHYAKAETFGTGLMDLGVGCFIASSALTTAMQRNARHGALADMAHTSAGGVGERPGCVAGESQTSNAAQQQPAATSHRRSKLRRAAILCALGLVRLLSTRAVDYHEHASEYGVHWNFFFTLAVVTQLLPLVPLVMDHPVATGCQIAVLHQLVLSRLDYITIIHSDERGPGILQQNKEGLGSLPGYAALYLLALGFGKELHSTCWFKVFHCHRIRVPGIHRRHGSAAAGRLSATWAVSLWVALGAVRLHLQEVSRRACNVPYQLWVLAVTFTTAAILLFSDWIVERGQREPHPAAPPAPAPTIAQYSSHPCLQPGANACLQPGESVEQLAAGQCRRVVAILCGFSKQQLPVFLVANVLTGLVNMSVNTLVVPDSSAKAIVLLYMLLLCGSTMMLEVWTRRQTLIPLM